MSNNSESQCYFIQLQIDSFLDGELSSVQQDIFHTHIEGCEECAKEYRFAQTIHDAALELPSIDCDDLVLEPAHRLGSTQGSRAHNLISHVIGWLQSVPASIRYGGALTALVVLVALIGFPSVQPENSVVQQDISYSPEEIQQAVEDLNVAIEYLNQIGMRTEALIGDRFLLSPIEDSINASFESIRKSSSSTEDDYQNDPI